MSSQGHCKEERLHVKVRSIDLDAPTLVDHIGRKLLDHLIACRVCTAIFADQRDSIGEAGCVDGRRIVSESQVRWQERRSTLALRHVTDETLDDYLFDRLIGDEREPLEYHAQVCLECSKKIRERETLISCMKMVFRERLHCKILIKPSGGRGRTLSGPRPQRVLYEHVG
jgi:hypothetical protein